jgi:hypothetical protein
MWRLVRLSRQEIHKAKCILNLDRFMLTRHQFVNSITRNIRSQLSRCDQAPIKAISLVEVDRLILILALILNQCSWHFIFSLGFNDNLRDDSPILRLYLLCYRCR